MAERWQTPQKFCSKRPLTTLSTATKPPLTSNRSEALASKQQHHLIQLIASDNVMLLELLEANRKHNNTNIYLKNKFALGQILKEMSFVKDLLSQHSLLGEFWDIVKPYNIYFTFVVLQMILKDKRSFSHAQRLFDPSSPEFQYLKTLDSSKLRKQFFSFVNNRICRKHTKQPMYQMKIINPPCRTIRVEFTKQDELVQIVDEVYNDGHNALKSREPSELEFKKLVWDAWDERR